VDVTFAHHLPFANHQTMIVATPPLSLILKRSPQIRGSLVPLDCGSTTAEE
jgi:hypothetical protein